MIYRDPDTILTIFIMIVVIVYFVVGVLDIVSR